MSAETCGAAGKRFDRRRRPSGSTWSILFSTTSTGSSACSDLVQHVVDCFPLPVLLVVGRRGIDDVQHHVGDERLLQRRREAFDELVRQAPDEADGVGDEVAAPVVLEAARRRIERMEELVLDRDLRAGQPVQERRLADVRVARERDRRRLGAMPLLPPRRALLLEILQLPLQDGDAVPRQPAVGLELRLTRAARADPAAEPLEVLPHAAHARQVVFELRELDLQLAFGARRVLREDVEDQLGAVDHARVERVLEESLLCRVELVVDEQALGAGFLVALLQLLELALADVRPLRRAGAVLDDLADRLDARRPGELLDLGQLVGHVRTLSEHREDEPALGLRGTWNHRSRLWHSPSAPWIS